MPAVRTHDTAVSDAPWDGPANEARVRSGEDESYYRRIYAWQDPDGDSSTKAAWRFIHHEVDAEGNPGPANVIACRTGIAVLNGARGGTTIPRADYRGVWQHLAAHLEAAGVEPPELRAQRQMEIRSARMRFTEDVTDAGEFRGYASVFGARDSYGDIIARGAFRKTLSDSPTRPLLWGHDPLEPIGVVELAEDNRGLYVRGRLALDVARAREALSLMRMGAVRGMSIGFFTRAADENGGGRIIREIELVEVSLTAFPAQPLARIDTVEPATLAAQESTSDAVLSVDEPSASLTHNLAVQQQYLRLLAARLR